VTTTHHHHQKRHASIGDKISGALLRLKGSLTRRPGQKVRFSGLLGGGDMQQTLTLLM
jgi:hypothetical protein